MIKREVIFTGPIGLGCWLCGIIYIDRRHPTKARGTVDQTADIIKDSNVSSVNAVTPTALH